MKEVGTYWLMLYRDRYRKEMARLIEERRRLFPPGTVVRSVTSVNHYGVVAADGECPPDRLPITFENGNTWYKELDQFEAVHDMKTLPRCVRQQVIKHKIGRKVVFAR